MKNMDIEGFEPSASRMQNGRSTTELNAPDFRLCMSQPGHEQLCLASTYIVFLFFSPLLPDLHRGYPTRTSFTEALARLAQR